MRSQNPRETRAFAHAARAKANANPTAENIAAALKYDAVIQDGPKKSKAMGRSAAITGLDATHVAFVDWTAVSEDTHEGNVGGVLIPKDLAAAVRQESNAEKPDFRKWHEAIISPYRWTAGTPEGYGVRHLDAIPLVDVVQFPEVTHDFDGSPRDVAPDETALAAISKIVEECQ